MPTFVELRKNHSRIEIASRQRSSDRPQQVHSSVGQADAGTAAEGGEAQALRQRLPEQAPSAGAEDQTRNDLSLPCRPLGEQ